MDAVTSVPLPVNEPIRGYAPGSAGISTHRDGRRHAQAARHRGDLRTTGEEVGEPLLLGRRPEGRYPRGANLLSEREISLTSS